MSAMQRSLPWAVSNTFVCVLTWYGGLGFGVLVWRVEADVGRVRFCILKGNGGEAMDVAVQHRAPSTKYC